MRQKLLFTTILTLFVSTFCFGQIYNILELPTSINQNGNVPNASSILELQAVDKGFLIPRMTSGSRNAIANPANGLLVFDLSFREFYFYDTPANAWQPLNEDLDSNPNNELQTISLSGNSLTISGGNTISIPVNSNPLLEDADADTKIQLEESGDDDKIRFDLAGTEHFVMDGPRIDVFNSGESVFIGENAGQFDNLATNNFNTAVGYDSFHDNTSGSWCTGFGADALHHNLTGQFNTGVGKDALHETDNGNYNTAIGSEAGYFSKGSNNTFLGANTNVATTTLNNVTAIGYNITMTTSNSVRVGNNLVTSIGGYANWTNVSDGRFKNNVQEDIQGLDFIQQLRPVSYHLDRNKISRFLGTDDVGLLSDETPVRQVGFIAQEVEEAAKNLGFEFSGIETPANDKSHYGLRYAEFVVPLVKGMQEQQTIIETQSEEIANLKSQFAEMKSEIDQIKALLKNN